MCVFESIFLIEHPILVKLVERAEGVALLGEIVQEPIEHFHRFRVCVVHQHDLWTCGIVL